MNSKIIREKFSYSLLDKNNINNLYHIEVPNIIKINDKRKIQDFKLQTFGGYKKSDVVSKLDKAIQTENLDYAIYLSLQLLLSGIISPLIDKFYNFAAKYINTNNPKLPIILFERYKKFNSFLTNKLFQKEAIFLLRNNSEFRNLIVEIITLITLSRKKKLEQIPKITQNDYNSTTFKSKLEAKDTLLIEKIVQENDPSEIKIAINEFAYHLSKRNISKCLYWLGWIFEWEKINIKRYGKYEIHYRHTDNVDSKSFKNVVWLIWDVINDLRNNSILFHNVLSTQDNESISALWNLYKYNFTLGQKNKRKPYIIWAIKCMTSNVNWEIPLIDRENLLFKSIFNINLIIQKFKTQEVTNAYNNSQFNVIIKDNYMIPEKHKKYEQDALKKAELKRQKEKEKLAKKKKISIQSLDKLSKMQMMDKILNS